MSSQSVKRALRESAFFELDLKPNIGTRTKRLFEKLVEHLVAQGTNDGDARKAAEQVAAIFGKPGVPMSIACDVCLKRNLNPRSWW